MKHLLIALTVLLAACQTIPSQSAPTSAELAVASVVEDTLSIGLVPVLARNPSYVPAAAALAASLGTLDGQQLTPEGVVAFLARTSLAPDDQRQVAGIVVAAYAAYQRRYAQQVGASTRPDVKLFLAAVSRGITAAIAAVPR